MIKRNGVSVMNARTNNVALANVSVMNARTNNVALAKGTLGIIEQGNYLAPSGNIVDVSDRIKSAIVGTQFHKSSLTLKEIYLTKKSPTIQVINETTSQAAARLLSEGKTDIVALNFAAARNVGGGFLGGAIAQEEDLCRASSLYACLKSKPQFYNDNLLSEDTCYTDGMLYSPKVPFFRDHHNSFLEEPLELSIITAPAPNNNTTATLDAHKVQQCIFHRTLKILQIAELYGHKNIILGAWGCGAFGNDPEQIAQAFKEALDDLPVFEHICFAVYDTRENTPVYQTFKDCLTK
jgi:uncharacterized protein (TIGR02452 family)